MDNETSRDKILELVFKKPTTRFHVREIARLTGLNPNTVAKIAGNLRKEKLVQIEKKKHVVEIYANAVDESFIKKKRVFNFMKVYESGIVDFLVKILFNFINKKRPPNFFLVNARPAGKYLLWPLWPFFEILQVEEFVVSSFYFSNPEAVFLLQPWLRGIHKNRGQNLYH